MPWSREGSIDPPAVPPLSREPPANDATPGPVSVAGVALGVLLRAFALWVDQVLRLYQR
jgi:hypothetical protein